MTFQVYLLSVLDGVGLFAQFVGVIFILGALITFFATGESRHLVSEHRKQERDEAWATWFGAKRVGYIGIGLLVLGALIPSRSDLIEAWVVSEGRKLATAKNAEQAAAEVAKRIDALTAALAGKAQP